MTSITYTDVNLIKGNVIQSSEKKTTECDAPKTFAAMQELELNTFMKFNNNQRSCNKRGDVDSFNDARPYNAAEESMIRQMAPDGFYDTDEKRQNEILANEDDETAMFAPTKAVFEQMNHDTAIQMRQTFVHEGAVNLDWCREPLDQTTEEKVGCTGTYSKYSSRSKEMDQFEKALKKSTFFD